MASLSEIVFKLLFSEEYLSGYIVMPYLFVAPLLLMLYQVVVNQFLVIKKTWPSVIILAIGAITNVVINALLIPMIGIEGAAIGTFLGYVAAIIGVIIVLSKMKLVCISGRFYLCASLFISFALVWRLLLLDKYISCLLLAVGIIILYGFMYRADILKVLQKK